jgi:hypothetical protein
MWVGPSMMPTSHNPWLKNQLWRTTNSQCTVSCTVAELHRKGVEVWESDDVQTDRLTYGQVDVQWVRWEVTKRTGHFATFTSLCGLENNTGDMFGLIGANVSWIHNECITNTFIFREKEVIVILVMIMIKTRRVILVFERDYEIENNVYVLTEFRILY